MSLPPGARLGPYEIVAPLGSGGMGEVYRARDARLDRDVAIKVLPGEVGAHPEKLRRFAQEARAAAALNHPNVVAVYDVQSEGETPYVVSELLEGETLRSTLQRGGMPVRRALELTIQIASGLAAAHQKGIVHRDVKPANIFLTPDGRAKVLDFGLARVVEPGDTDHESTQMTGGPATRPGTVLGTVGYMAPEQVRGEAVDSRADVFALGVVCYEMLAGRRAFDRDSAVEVLAAIVRDDPPDLPDRVPTSVARVVRRCLEKSPAQRFQSMTDLGFALEAVAASSMTTTPASSPALSLPPVPAPRRSWPVVPLAAALVGLAAGAVAMWALGGGRASVAPPVTYEAKTFDRLPVMNARFMPDGQTIVYSAAGRGFAPSLYVISPSAEAPQDLGVPNAHLLSVSRKGELALVVNARYLSQRLYAGTLARMTLGSSPRAVLESVREADWGPDGESLALVHDLGNGRDRLEYPPGTSLHEVTGYLSDPRVSPDGSRVAFVAHPWRFDDRGTVMVVDRAGTARTLTPELWSIEGMAWTPDGGTVVFSGNESGGSAMQPMAVAADGGAPHRPVVRVPARLIVHDVASDGRWLAAREDLAIGVKVRLPGEDAERELGWLGSSNARSLSRDGRQLLMVDIGLRSGPAYGVILRDTSGSGAVRLGTGSAERLSPDGRWAAAVLASPPEVVLYPTGPGAAKRFARGRFEPVTSVQWFPDAQHLLVCGAEDGTSPRCYRTDLDGTAFTPAADQGVQVELGPDGTTVLLVGSDRAYRRGRLGDGAAVPVAALTPADRIVGWSRDSAAVFVQREYETPVRIDRVHLATGERTTVQTLSTAHLGEPASVLVADWIDEGPAYAYNYSVSPSVLFLVSGVRP